MALAENWGVGPFEGVEGSIYRNTTNCWSVFKNIQSDFPLDLGCPILLAKDF